MKSKIGKIIIFLFVSIFYSLDASIDQFNFDVPEIEILKMEIYLWEKVEV